jgi:hypothetical protein
MNLPTFLRDRCEMRTLEIILISNLKKGGDAPLQQLNSPTTLCTLLKIYKHLHTVDRTYSNMPHIQVDQRADASLKFVF